MVQTKLNQNIKFLKGVGPSRAEILASEISVYTFRDLLYHFPFRYIDKTSFQKISDIRQDGEVVQLKGKLVSLNKVRGKWKPRLTGLFKDNSGLIELVWFQGIPWVEKSLVVDGIYLLYGKSSTYNRKKIIAHPELELIESLNEKSFQRLDPVYSSTEKLGTRGLDSKGIRKLVHNLIDSISEKDAEENIPDYLLKSLRLCSRFESLNKIHFPKSETELVDARKRIKFEEIFFLQINLLNTKKVRAKKLKGLVFSKIGTYFNRFYSEKLPFKLTKAQKKVVKEIRADLGSGRQMNRLLQGDVGSGKTIVALMCMLIALDNGFQACLMAPTEILAYQHFHSLSILTKSLKIRIGFLTGSVTGNRRKDLLKLLKNGDIHIVIGTHALLEENVEFNNLGLAITDEQHRFGVAQRAKLWIKRINRAPHILVMTATPIPRTLSMTVYGDLDISTIDELPPGRKYIKTVHRSEMRRPQVIQFMHQEIKKGRQIYVVFPLIEESESLDLQNLQLGYEQLLQFFPPPDYQLSVMHGKMNAKDKEFEMQRFVEGSTNIMVATTVIEVGVDVPNATVMIIENAERFGLSQLHQLRGRVGRGGEQSYCILMSGQKLTKEAKERISTMCRTNNGFEIAEVDMRLRGPGDIQGTRQSGVKDFILFDLIRDSKILQTARNLAIRILDDDPELRSQKNSQILRYVKEIKQRKQDWGRIS